MKSTPFLSLTLLLPFLGIIAFSVLDSNPNNPSLTSDYMETAASTSDNNEAHTYIGSCSVGCRDDLRCETTGCDGSFSCTCNWLGNPVCDCEDDFDEIAIYGDERIKDNFEALSLLLKGFEKEYADETARLVTELKQLWSENDFVIDSAEDVEKYLELQNKLEEKQASFSSRELVEIENHLNR